MEIPAHIIPRFWSRVARDAADECWRWLAGCTTAGYGIIHPAQGVTLYAHRLAWQLASGTAPPVGWLVLHTCDNPACVRNDDMGTYTVAGVSRLRFGHLWLGTDADNMHDMAAKGRHGVHAHPERFTGAPLGHPSPTGEAHHSAKLTDADIRAIRAIPEGTMPQREMARAYGVSQHTIWSIRTGKAWRHVVS